MKKVKVLNTNEIKIRKLSENVIWLLMFVISMIHGLMRITPGILSSCVTQIKNDFKLSDEKFGMFGTMSGFGSLVGSLLFTLIIEKINHKNLICNMLIINCFCHFAFYFKSEYPILLISRFISGLASVFCFIYFPMWVDRFAMKQWINFMQTTVQLTNTIGHIFGYFIYLKLGSQNWKYGFLIEIFSISCFVLIMIIIPNKYYDKNYENKEWNEINTYEACEQEKETIKNDIICNIPYILITLYRGNRLFIFVAIDFWYSDYIQNTLMIDNSLIIFWSYTIAIVISNIIGNVLGGLIIHLIGGINSKYSFDTMALLQFMCVLFGIFAPFTEDIFYFTLLISLYMILNSASGIITISASFAVMPNTLRGTATGIYSIVVNLIAFLPAPYAYAFIKNIVDEGQNIMIILMLYGIVGGFELIIADKYMRVKKIKIHKEDYKYEALKMKK